MQYLHTTRRGMSPRHLKIMKKDYMDLHREQIPVSCNLQHKQTCRWTILPSDIKKTVVIRIFQLLLIIKRTVEINLNIQVYTILLGRMSQRGGLAHHGFPQYPSSHFETNSRVDILRPIHEFTIWDKPTSSHFQTNPRVHILRPNHEFTLRVGMCAYRIYSKF